MVSPEVKSRMTRSQSWLIDIREKIENNLDYPGNIKVTVIRELRAVDYAK